MLPVILSLSEVEARDRPPIFPGFAHMAGHPRRQLQPAQEPADAPRRPRASPPCSTTWMPAACSTRRWSSGSASSAASPHITRGNAGREHWPRCYSRRPGRRRHPRRGGPRRLRPLGRLPGPRPRQPRRPRRHDPPRPRHRPGDRGPRPRRPPDADQLRQPADGPVRLAATVRLAPGGSRPARPPTLARFRTGPAPAAWPGNLMPSAGRQRTRTPQSPIRPRSQALASAGCFRHHGTCRRRADSSETCRSQAT